MNDDVTRAVDPISHSPTAVPPVQIARSTGAATGGTTVAPDARRSLVEVYPDGRFDMLPPLREVGRDLATTTGDAVAAQAGLLRWVDRVLPQEANTGAADAPWLAEIELVDAAVREAASAPETRPQAYALANRAFSSLYTAMRAREAVD